MTTRTLPAVPTPASASTDAARPGPARRRFAALVRAEVTILWRNRTAVFTAVALPFFMALAFSGVEQSGLGAALVIALVGTSLVFAIYYTLVTSLVARREQLVLKRLVSGEATPLELLTAPAVPLWVLFGVQSAIALGGALLLRATVVHWWALVLALVGGAITWSALAAASAVFTRTVESAQLSTLPLILISLLLSGFAVPLQWLPEVVQRIAHLLPMTPVVDLLNLAFAGVGTTGTPVGGPGEALLAAGMMLLPLVGWTALSVWVALTRFRWDPRG